jgi:hypothetical protein
MAAFYADENVSLGLERLLRPRGHAFTTTHAERRLGSPDSHQLLFAATRGWTLITHNRGDFRLLHDAWHLWSDAWRVSPQHAGILVLEPVPGQTAADVAELIQDIVTRRDVSLPNALYDWGLVTGWVRFPRQAVRRSRSR